MRMTSGSCRSTCLSALAKLCVSWPTSRWLTSDCLFVCRNSIGSSTVTMWSARVRLTRSISAASVVDLPEPVGPVTRTSPRGSCGEVARRPPGTPSCSSGLISVGMRRKARADRTALLVEVDAEARVRRQREREVEFELARRTSRCCFVGQDAVQRGCDALAIPDPWPVDRQEGAVDAEHRRRADGDVKVGARPRDSDIRARPRSSGSAFAARAARDSSSTTDGQRRRSRRRTPSRDGALGSARDGERRHPSGRSVPGMGPAVRRHRRAAPGRSRRRGVGRRAAEVGALSAGASGEADRQERGAGAPTAARPRPRGGRRSCEKSAVPTGSRRQLAALGGGIDAGGCRARRSAVRPDRSAGSRRWAGHARSPSDRVPRMSSRSGDDSQDLLDRRQAEQGLRPAVLAQRDHALRRRESRDLGAGRARDREAFDLLGDRA